MPEPPDNLLKRDTVWLPLAIPMHVCQYPSRQRGPPIRPCFDVTMTHGEPINLMQCIAPKLRITQAKLNAAVGPELCPLNAKGPSSPLPTV